MSYQEAKAAAVQWAAAAGFTGDLSGKILLLPAFDSEADCRYFLPDRPHGFHLMMVQAAERTARKAGAKVIKNFLRSGEYRDWLRFKGLQDSSFERSNYFITQAILISQ